ncbi:hypothetical protein Tco_0611394 [Tanacetum coccineum]
MILSRIWILFPKDSVDENSLDDNLVDTISEMFTDEHALDYSSPPLWDEYDDELFDLETVNDDTYDDPFDFKEEKIKESKTLIDELDLPGLRLSMDFLKPLVAIGFSVLSSLELRIQPHFGIDIQILSTNVYL